MGLKIGISKLMFMLIGLLIISAPCMGRTVSDIENEIADLKKQLIGASNMVSAHRNEPDYRNTDFEDQKKDNLIKWSQKMVQIRNKIKLLNTELRDLREREKFYANQPKPRTPPPE